MFNKEEFITNFVAAAKENDQEKMAELAHAVPDEKIQDRVDLLQELITKLKETKGTEEVTQGLEATLDLMKLAIEAEASAKGEEDSAGEDAKEDTKAEEAAQDVAADTSADEAEVAEQPAASEGEAPAEEEKAEKEETK